MTDEPDSKQPANIILHILREIREDMAAMRGDMATTKGEVAGLKSDVTDLRSDVADLRSDMHSLRADVASDIMTLRSEIGDQVAGLRRAVLQYHSSVVGHGFLISDLEARMRRVEQHLTLPPMETA